MLLIRARVLWFLQGAKKEDHNGKVQRLGQSSKKAWKNGHAQEMNNIVSIGERKHENYEWIEGKKEEPSEPGREKKGKNNSDVA